MEQNKKITHKDRAQRRGKIAKLIEKGESPYSVAKTFGVSVDLIYKSCRENGVNYSKSEGLTSNKTLKIIRDLILDNETQNELTKKYNVSRQRINQIKTNAIDAQLLGENAVWKRYRNVLQIIESPSLVAKIEELEDLLKSKGIIK